ncbi:hypothetical protein PCANC_28879 [Puccinia coronata f. sp. avenae]|uniref:Uncharacterized protein n=1 Tax=Puccinia coronata f. sp. avenae TaxID=200324 RepID=A0A2N5TPR8_9BASI|nr:hypothetical protein PCANC_28879 [Puccinia coronata f. sp. avenae]PLW27517.1 hypothetical protein PCASD_26291 [Puccinia coronata f. sp. avenae]
MYQISRNDLSKLTSAKSSTKIGHKGSWVTDELKLSIPSSEHPGKEANQNKNNPTIPTKA